MQTPPFETETETGRPDTPPRTLERSRSRRGTFLKWLRRIHGWIGLWGALLGLLFGVTGFLQNHRATMKINSGEPTVSAIQVALPSPPPESPRELAAYLQSELKLDRPASRIGREPAKPVVWGDQSIIQPEHWTMRFVAPHYLVTAEFWQGSNRVRCRAARPGRRQYPRSPASRPGREGRLDSRRRLDRRCDDPAVVDGGAAVGPNSIAARRSARRSSSCRSVPRSCSPCNRRSRCRCAAGLVRQARSRTNPRPSLKSRRPGVRVNVSARAP